MYKHCTDGEMAELLTEQDIMKIIYVFCMQLDQNEFSVL